MWDKTIIVDRTVSRILTRNEKELKRAAITYVFAGFNKDTEVAEWCTKVENVKLFDTIAEAVGIARKLQADGAVGVINYQILAEQRHVSINEIKF